MSLLIDTSILIRQQKGDASVKRELDLLSKRFPETPAITFMNVFEYLIGIQAAKRKPEATKILENFITINTTEQTSEIMASIKSKYDKKGILFSLADLIIACLAIENGMTLLTSDADFKKIEELKVMFI